MHKLMLIMLLSLIADLGFAKDGINTTKIINQTLRAVPKCAKHQVRGGCLWLEWRKCKFFIKTPHISSTMYVSHYTPDLVISVYPDPKQNAWLDMNLVQKAELKVGELAAKKFLKFSLGRGQIEGSVNNSNNIRFKEVSVIGNPVGGLALPGVLPSQATAMVPYYNSVRDVALWRNPTIEMVAYMPYMLPKVKEVGGSSFSWGPIFPRTGFVNQIDDAKNAAVIAMRGASIVTTNNIHLARNITKNSCGKYCKGPGEIDNNSDTFFQMIYPVAEKSCHKLCESSDPDWLKQARQINSGYMWVVWRYYEGCKDGPGERIACLKR